MFDLTDVENKNFDLSSFFKESEDFFSISDLQKISGLSKKDCISIIVGLGLEEKIFKGDIIIENNKIEKLNTKCMVLFVFDLEYSYPEKFKNALATLSELLSKNKNQDQTLISYITQQTERLRLKSEKLGLVLKSLDFKKKKDRLRSEISNYDCYDEYRPGFVYVLENIKNSCCKIGFSKKPNKRKRMLIHQAGILRYNFFVSDLQKNGIKTEKKAHKYFKDYRIHGSEWFEVDFDIAKNYVNYISEKMSDKDFKTFSEYSKKKSNIGLLAFKEFMHNNFCNNQNEN